VQLDTSTENHYIMDEWKFLLRHVKLWNFKFRNTNFFLSLVQHFETDDKPLYKGKIQYILENDPSSLDIFFSEDVYDHQDKLVQVRMKSVITFAFYGFL